MYVAYATRTLHMQQMYVAYATHVRCICNIHVLHMQHTFHMQHMLHMQHLFYKKRFFQIVPDEIVFNNWVLIQGQVDCAKLKRNLERSKKRPGGS